MRLVTFNKCAVLVAGINSWVSYLTGASDSGVSLAIGLTVTAYGLALVVDHTPRWKEEGL